MSGPGRAVSMWPAGVEALRFAIQVDDLIRRR
jgi:hypothetical protein